MVNISVRELIKLFNWGNLRAGALLNHYSLKYKMLKRLTTTNFLQLFFAILILVLLYYLVYFICVYWCNKIMMFFVLLSRVILYN